MVRRVSRRGLSPLLAIIIGLVVTVVAGILLAQLYFSYAATISTRPAANIEYVDLVQAGATQAILALNIKNMGNQPIDKIIIARCYHNLYYSDYYSFRRYWRYNIYNNLDIHQSCRLERDCSSIVR